MDTELLDHYSILSEQIVVEYYQLNLTTIPRIYRIPTGEEDLALLERENFALIIATSHIDEINPLRLT